MGPWTLRLACLLTAAALIAGCGSGASVTTSSTARTASSAPAKKARSRPKARRTRARKRASKPSRFPASVESSFRRTCTKYVDGLPTQAPAQDHAVVASEIAQYCTCALHRVEASVATKQFEHDLVAVVYGQSAQPRYLVSAEQTCGVQFQQALIELNQLTGG
jgi:hypothetical protein